jgi:type VI secretion system secreted protein Hcp
MAIPTYMWIKDEQGSDIRGPVKIKGRENSIEVLSFTHEVRIPTDPDTGALTAIRKHEPFIITKEFDAATPILNKACASGKTLQSVKLSWYRINEKGQEEEYFRHMLHQVKVVSVKPIVHNIKEKGLERQSHLEEVAMRYEKIQWEYLEGNIITQDTWIERS